VPLIANAFGGTFAFLAATQSKTKKSKRATKPKHQYIADNGHNNNERQKGST
jgi:hypothetical protein